MTDVPETVSDREWERFRLGLVTADETPQEQLARVREIARQMINRDKN